MKNLVHGGDIYSAQKEIGKKIYDFSANINPLGVPDGIINAVTKCLKDCSNYPDPLCRDLIAKLAKAEGINNEYILCGNGAADIIFRITLSKKPKKALVTGPTFAEYEQALSVVDCKTNHYILKEEHDFAVQDDILDYMEDGIDIMFICNPNNPTGRLTDKNLMDQILQKSVKNNITLVVDECFIEFIQKPEELTVKSYLSKMDNLIILKAFTKNYAMAGFRLGYCLCSNKETLDKIYEMGQPWSVSIPAQVAGLAALDEDEYVRDAMEVISAERRVLVDALTSVGFKVFKPMANYIFFKIADRDGMKRGNIFREKMRSAGFLIRDCSNYVGLTHEFSRIAVRRIDENLAFIDAMKQVLKEMDG
ncbi:MAG: histidinol-phosphate transaminase [Anaerovoracaceae bacterium]